MEYMNSWLYGLSRIDEGFHEEVDKFIEATKKHASTLTYNKDTIICPCKDCKNLMAFRDVDTIKQYLIMRGLFQTTLFGFIMVKQWLLMMVTLIKKKTLKP
jgi:DNA replication initiation complex subunit (GINS family)